MRPRPRVAAGQEAAVGAHAVVHGQPGAAAVPAFAAGLRVQRHAVDEQAVAGLRHLRRAVERLAVEAGELAGRAVAPRVGPPAAQLGLDDRVVPPGFRVRAADDRAADRREMAGGHALRHMVGEAPPDQVVEADLHLEIEPQRGRRLRVEHRSGAGQYAKRPEAAAVAQQRRVGDGFEHHLGADRGAVGGSVVRPVVLVGVVGQVDDEGVVADLQRHLERPPVVLLLGQFEAAFRKLLQRRQRHPLAIVHIARQRPFERRLAVALDEVEQPALADADGRHPGPQVAFQEVGQARVGFHDLQHRGDRLAAGKQLHRRQPQPLLEDLAGIRRQRPRHLAADIVEMRDVGGPRDDLAIGEDRLGQDDVVEMGDPAIVRVVGDEDVAGLDAARTAGAAVDRQDAFDGLVEHADERRDAGARTGDLAIAVGDAGSHVQHLVDDRAHRRLAHRGEHLVGGGLQRVLHDLQGDRVGGGGLGRIGLGHHRAAPSR